MFTILIDIATVLVCALAVSGCGQEQAQVAPAPAPDATVAAASANAPVVAQDPAADPVATPTATPTPNPTVTRYIYQNINICTDLHTWDPTQVTIKTYTTAGNDESYYVLLRWDGAFIVTGGGCENGCAAPDMDLARSDIHGVVCTISIRNGQYTGVTP